MIQGLLKFHPPEMARALLVLPAGEAFLHHVVHSHSQIVESPLGGKFVIVEFGIGDLADRPSFLNHSRITIYSLLRRVNFTHLILAV